MNLENRIKETIIDVPDFPKKGIIFKDITPIFLNQKLVSDIVDKMVLSSTKVDMICGIESRGFLFGLLLANRLNVPFVLIRKKGKLPRDVYSQKYDLEYGTAEVEVSIGDIPKGAKVMIHDDLLATGGSALAAANLVKKSGATVVEFNFLIELEFLNGVKKLDDFKAINNSLISY